MGDAVTLVREIRQVLETAGRLIDSESDLLARMADVRARIEPGLPPPESVPEEPPASESEVRFHLEPLVEGHLYAVVGDLHGDFAAFDDIVRSFYTPDLDDEQVRKRHMVVLGDIMDRGRRDFQILHAVLMLRELLGDRVVLMRGNHEEWRIKEDGAPYSTAMGGDELLVNYLRPRVPPEALLTLHRHLEALPHCALLTHPEGNVVLVHAGVPPEFLLRRHVPEAPRDPAACRSALATCLAVETIRKAFLWGRGPIDDQERPNRPYPFNKFYDLDLDAFLGCFGASLLIRGHDVQRPGYGVQVGGRCVTISSSGTAIHGDNADTAFAGQVDLPRYLVLDPQRFNRAEKGRGEYEALDAGVAVREVFSRDIVLLVNESRDHADDIVALARLIHEELGLRHDLPVHVYRRRNYSVDASEFVGLLEPRSGKFDKELDRGFHNRLSFELASEGDRIVFRRWNPRGLRAATSEAAVRGEPTREFARQCVGLIEEAADFHMGEDPAPAADDTEKIAGRTCEVHESIPEETT